MTINDKPVHVHEMDVNWSDSEDIADAIHCNV